MAHNGVFFTTARATLGVRFRDRALLVSAVTRRAYLKELRDKYPDILRPDNERLEFLGDGILELVVRRHLSDEFRALPREQFRERAHSIIRSQGPWCDRASQPPPSIDGAEDLFISSIIESACVRLYLGPSIFTCDYYI